MRLQWGERGNWCRRHISGLSGNSCRAGRREQGAVWRYRFRDAFLISGPRVAVGSHRRVIERWIVSGIPARMQRRRGHIIGVIRGTGGIVVGGRRSNAAHRDYRGRVHDHIFDRRSNALGVHHAGDFGEPLLCFGTEHFKWVLRNGGASGR